MFNAPYEMVTGRHGLISDGFLLWKVGVKNVYNYEEKFVEAFPQLPHRNRGKTLFPRLIPKNEQLSPQLSETNVTHLSTTKNQNVTDEGVGLFTQSTPPITTTTTYINRREGHQE